MIQRWLGFWVLRRAYRILFAEDARPLADRLVGEAKRILFAAAVVVLLLLAALVALIVLAVHLLS